MKIAQKVSVIIPTLNRNQQLKRCLQSLLVQTVPPEEIIVVDNSRTGKAKDLVNSIKKNTRVNIKYLVEPKKGVSRARNCGIKEARYPILAFIDDDCIAKKNWIFAIKNFFNNPRVNVVFGKNLNGESDNVFACLEHFSCESLFKSNVFKRSIYWKSNILDSKNLVIRKSFMIEHRLWFDPHLSMLVDIDLAFQIKTIPADIFYNPLMVVSHYGRSNLFRHWQRELTRGNSNYIFNKKWNQDKFYHQSKIIDYINKRVDSRETQIKNKIIKKILNNKKIFFKIIFVFFIYLDKLLLLVNFKIITIKSRLVNVVNIHE